jgi:hypothetical protein
MHLGRPPSAVGREWRLRPSPSPTAKVRRAAGQSQRVTFLAHMLTHAQPRVRLRVTSEVDGQFMGRACMHSSHRRSSRGQKLNRRRCARRRLAPPAASLPRGTTPPGKWCSSSLSFSAAMAFGIELMAPVSLLVEVHCGACCHLPRLACAHDS